MHATVWAAEVKIQKVSRTEQLTDWIRGWQIPISIPQLAPVAMMLVIAFFFFSQTVSADGTISGVYQKSVELATETYQQSADIFEGEKLPEIITSEGN